MPMRHPLRNEFDEIKVQLDALAKKPNAEGAQARAMLAMMPGFIDWLETERDKGTSPFDRLNAMRAVTGNITRQAVIAAGAHLGTPEATLERFLVLVCRDVAERIKPSSKLILPGLPH